MFVWLVIVVDWYTGNKFVQWHNIEKSISNAPTPNITRCDFTRGCSNVTSHVWFWPCQVEHDNDYVILPYSSYIIVLVLTHPPQNNIDETWNTNNNTQHTDRWGSLLLFPFLLVVFHHHHHHHHLGVVHYWMTMCYVLCFIRI